MYFICMELFLIEHILLQINPIKKWPGGRAYFIARVPARQIQNFGFCASVVHGGIMSRVPEWGR